MSKSLKGNIWKLFIAEVTQREYYFPILTIYFLTLPDTNVRQIGLWMGIGYLAEFLFEIPSGFISDRIGHKKMLLLSKLSMIAAALLFIGGGSITSFILGAIFTAFSFAAQSGTYTAFLHETMTGLRREKSFIGIASKIFANARLASAFLLILIPLGAQIALQTPLYIGLVLDVIGLVVVALLVKPPVVEKTTLKKSIPTLLRELRGSGFYPVIIFTSAITGFAIAQMSYIYPYMESLGFPIAFVGLIAGLRSLAQYFVGNNIAKFEKRINIKRIFLFDLVLFSSSFVLISFLNNFYIITLILIIVGGYEVGRSGFINGYLSKYYIKDKNYMATTLSIKGQTIMLFNFITAFGIGFIMKSSYKAGFYVMGGTLFLILLVTFLFVENRKTSERS